MTTSNKCQGTIHTTTCETEPPNPQLQALIDKANDKRSYWSKAEKALSDAWEGTKRIAQASVNNPGDTAVGVGKGVVNLIPDMWNLLVMGGKYSGPVSPVMQAEVINYGAMQAYQSGDTARANAMASYASEMMSSGYVGNIFDMNNDAQKGGGVLSMLLPAGAVAKGLGAGAKLMRGAKTVEVAETARVAETAAARTAGEAANATKTAAASADATKSAPISDGVAILAAPVSKAKAPIEKFRDYIFKPDATHGKQKVFESLGYKASDSEALSSLYAKQAGEKFAAGEFSLGKLDSYGQRIDIRIDLPGIGGATGKMSSLKSGWMMNADGSISLNTPFSGFMK